ncbi:MAG: sulfotransferase [Rhizobacter sp.]|nr:sulfotransferase [Rhizobacter sp.]
MHSTEREAQIEALAEVREAATRGELTAAHELALAAKRWVEQPGVMQRVLNDLERETGFRPGASAAPEVWRRYGGLSARAGNLADAQVALDLALALEPDVYRTRIDAGTVAFMRAELPTAQLHFERAAALKPAEPEPLASLAAVAARQQRHGDARELAERALALRPGLVTAHMAIARADLLEGLAARAEARMSELLASSALNEAQRIGALDLRADALDALDRPADAFANYTSRNAILERINAPRVAAELRERSIDQARRLARWFESAPPEPWRTKPGADKVRVVREHVFLMGFPRSGTTLLEKTLACHPDISTLEEVDHLSAAAGGLLASDAALRQLANLNPTQADAIREAYWRGVETSVGTSLSGRILVDKLPLHTIAMPLIARIFPDAKILFGLRDPRDVVLSCFRRRFQVNAAMFELLTLEGAARYYAAVMSLARQYRSLLPLEVHEVRHEAMVADFEGEARKTLAFVGAEWNPAVHGFAERARARAVTPSDLQLTRGLNADGLGQWRRYEASLAPAMEIIEPWITHYGYAQA